MRYRLVALLSICSGGELVAQYGLAHLGAYYVRARGAAGAQVPYKHKVGGANPSATTMS